MDELKISRLFVNTIYPLREDEYLDEEGFRDAIAVILCEFMFQTIRRSVLAVCVNARTSKSKRRKSLKRYAAMSRSFTADRCIL